MALFWGRIAAWEQSAGTFLLLRDFSACWAIFQDPCLWSMSFIYLKTCFLYLRKVSILISLPCTYWISFYGTFFSFNYSSLVNIQLSFTFCLSNLFRTEKIWVKSSTFVTWWATTLQRGTAIAFSYTSANTSFTSKPCRECWEHEDKLNLEVYPSPQKENKFVKK